MAPLLSLCVEERLDVVLHRGAVAGVLASADDVHACDALEVLSADGRWRLRAAVDPHRRQQAEDGAWAIGFDRRSAAIELLAVPRDVGPPRQARVLR